MSGCKTGRRILPDIRMWYVEGGRYPLKELSKDAAGDEMCQAKPTLPVEHRSSRTRRRPSGSAHPRERSMTGAN